MNTTPSPARHTIELNNPTNHQDDNEFINGECYPPQLVEHFLNLYTQPGDTILDPFAGSGTTLLVAEKHHRIPIGIELDHHRVELCAKQLNNPQAIRHGDARTLQNQQLPPIDFVMTSPPYMTRHNHPDNPLNAYQTTDAHYPTYLNELANIFHTISTLLKPGAHVIINAANLTYGNHYTPLAWDIANKIDPIIPLQSETIINWKTQPDWLTNDYCLIFQKPTT